MIYYLTRSASRLASIIPKDSLSASATLVDIGGRAGLPPANHRGEDPVGSRLAVLAWSELYQDVYDNA